MIDLSAFPITPAMAYSVAGAAVICVLLTEWVKQYLPDWRYTSLLSLGLTLAIVEAAAALFVAGASLGERLFCGLLMSIAGASLATWGYEVVLNLIGKAGVGPRSDQALQRRE